MIKNLTLSIISTYQIVFSTALKHIFGMPVICRYDTTCSEYAKQQVSKNGAVRGSAIGLKRLLSCQPFFHSNKKPANKGDLG